VRQTGRIKKTADTGPVSCGNCGAQYGADLRQCPYCGAENTVFIDREFRQSLEHIDRQAKELKHLPKQVAKLWARRWGRILFIGLALVMLTGILGAAVRAVGTWVSNKTAPERQEKHLAALDAYAADGDYEKVGEYLREHGLYGGVYGEYSDIYGVAYYYSNVEEFRSELEEGGVWPSSLEWTAWEVTEGILMIEEDLATHTYVRGCDAVLESMRADMRSFLLEELGLTEEELEQVKTLVRERGEEDGEDIADRMERCAIITREAAKRRGIHLYEEGIE